MSEEVLQLLLSQGFVAEIDLHFARLMDRLAGGQFPDLFLAAAFLSRTTREGHVCLDLAALGGTSFNAEKSNLTVPAFPPLSQWLEHLKDTEVVGKPGDFRPLILDDHARLYVYRYWAYEKTLADNLKTRARLCHGGVDMALLKDGLTRLFPQDSPKELDWQRIAAFVSVLKGLCVISGGPGTGKSTLAARILALILEQGEEGETKIALAAPTGKAAARLQEAIRNARQDLRVKEQIRTLITGQASTIHRLLGTIPGSPYFRHNEKDPLPFNVVIVDEASMVDLALMAKLATAVPMDARLILLGDKNQLSSVEAGAVLGDVCGIAAVPTRSEQFCRTFSEILGDRLPGNPDPNPEPAIRDCLVELQKNYRFQADSGIAAVSRAVNMGNDEWATDLLKSGRHADVKWRDLPRAEDLPRALGKAILNGFQPYLSTADPLEAIRLFEGFRILCALRIGPYGVSSLNATVERILKNENLIDTSKRWYKGRPVMVTSNDYTLGLFNGDIGVILPDIDDHHRLKAFFISSDGVIRSFIPTRLPEHETVYAMTVHKSQGSEFQEAILILPDQPNPVVTRELIYTGISRVRKYVEVWAREEVFREGVKEKITRNSGLRDALWSIH
jgi:exodeoxyribonuclease V alpha subunit